MNTGATLATLQRTKSSGFTLEESVSLEDLAQQLDAERFIPLPPDVGLQSLPSIQLNADETTLWCQGRRPVIEQSQYVMLDGFNAVVRILGPDNQFLGIGALLMIEETTVLTHRMVYASQ